MPPELARTPVTVSHRLGATSIDIATRSRMVIARHRLARPSTEATVRDILGATTVVATMLDRSLRRSVVLNLDAGLVRILVAGVVAASGRAWVIGAPGRAVVGVRTRSVRRRLARGPGLRRRFAPVRGSLRPGRARSVRGP
jgi:hypothetical protein